MKPLSPFGSNPLSIERSHNRNDVIDGVRGRREMVPEAIANVATAMEGSGQVELAPPQAKVAQPAITEISGAPIRNLVELDGPEVRSDTVESQAEPQTDMLAEARRARDAAFLPDTDEDESLGVAA